jgi:hypothetical protein
MMHIKWNIFFLKYWDDDIGWHFFSNIKNDKKLSWLVLTRFNLQNLHSKSWDHDNTIKSRSKQIISSISNQFKVEGCIGKKIIFN